MDSSERFIQKVACDFQPGLMLKPKQMESLKFILDRRGDVIVNLPVGYGKSIIFQLLPALFRSDSNPSPVVAVISPLNIIQQDQLKALRDRNVTACRISINGRIEETTDGNNLEQEETFFNLCSGKFSIVLCHPEALLNSETGKIILSDEAFKGHVSALVIDECHVIEKWGEEFRKSFKELKSLRTFFPNVPVVALSGTLTNTQKKTLPSLLSLKNHALIEFSPDKQNIFFQKFEKISTCDVEGEYEIITHAICDKLFDEKEKFPVTLLFIPVHYMSQTLMYLNNLFKCRNIDTALYSAICSGQDPYVIDKTVMELKKSNPQIRLILTTSMLGMGFDPENVTNIVHTYPPRNVSQYFQEIGRAGRRGQPATVTLYYSARNIAKNLPGINEDIIAYCKSKDSCLRNNLLSVFGFEKDLNIVDCKCCSFCKEKCACDECLLLNIDFNNDLFLA